MEIGNSNVFFNYSGYNQGHIDKYSDDSIQNPEEVQINSEKPDNAVKNSESEKENEKKQLDKKGELTKQELKEVETLKKRDREVRAHEMAHIAAGGQYITSGAAFEYKRGADGGSYAVSGEVKIDTSKESGDPEKTIKKMQIVKAAALAPKEPSSADRAVAAKAVQIEAHAQAELFKKRTEEALEGEEEIESDNNKLENNKSDVEKEDRDQIKTANYFNNEPDFQKGSIIDLAE